MVATPEALSGLLTAETSFYQRVSLVICDEGHLLDSVGRGVALELLLARFKTRKGGSPRFVFVSAIVPNVEEINAWLFITERGEQFTRQGIYYLVRRIGERADLSRVHPHMLRHACGYALANKGHDLRTIQDYLGHRDPKHTAIYTRTAAKRFERLWH